MIHEEWWTDAPPKPEVWAARRKQYESIMAQTLVSGASNVPQQSLGLETELERTYCTGAWVAVVAMAAALIEVYSAHRGWHKGPAQHDLLQSLGIVDEFNWLRSRRNALLHYSQNDKSLPAQTYARDRSVLEQEATKAVIVALKFYHAAIRV